MKEIPAPEDRISALPDKVLTHILSFLPIEDVISTSDLSERWSSIPVHKFSFTIGSDFQTDINILKFAIFVHSNLLFCFEGKFHLEITYTHTIYKESLTRSLNRWSEYVMQRNVQQLALIQHFIPEEDYPTPERAHYLLIPKLPDTVLKCKTLTELKLRWFTTKVDVSGCIFAGLALEFPLLKVLHFEFLEFDTDRDFALILAACPNLEDYKVSHVYSSERAYFRRFRKKNAPLHVEFGHLRFNHLVKADMTGLFIDIPMQLFQNLVFLRIQLNKVYHPMPSEFPVFRKLTHMVINYDWHEMTMEVLNHCPNLQNLELYQRIDKRLTHLPYPPSYLPRVNEFELPETWVDPAAAPPCVTLHLRNCSIRDFGFMDLKRDICLAKFILKNAGVINTMSIWRWSGINKVQFEAEISSSLQASATCRLSIY